MTAIDIDRWSDYTDSFSQHIVKEPEKKQDAQYKKNVATSSKISARHSQDVKNSGNSHRRSFKECGFIWPIEINKFWLSSLFGPRKRVDGSWGFHHGIDN